MDGCNEANQQGVKFMTILTKKDLLKMEEYYYWSGNKQYVPFPADLKEKLLGIYGEEPLHIIGRNKISMKVPERP